MTTLNETLVAVFSDYVEHPKTIVGLSADTNDCTISEYIDSSDPEHSTWTTRNTAIRLNTKIDMQKLFQRLQKLINRDNTETDESLIDMIAESSEQNLKNKFGDTQ